MVRLRRTSLAAALIAAAAASATAQSPLPLGPRFAVNLTTLSNQLGPDIAMAPDGRFEVAWTSLHVVGHEVLHRGYTAGGSAGAELALNQFSTGDQNGVRLSMNASGDWAASWRSVDQFGPTSDLDAIVRRTSSNGAVLENEHLAQTSSAPEPEVTAVARHADDSYLVVWREALVLAGHRFAANGTSLGGDEILATLDFSAGFDVAPLPAGRSIVVFQSNVVPDHHLLARFVAADGSAEGFPFPLDEADGVVKGRPSVAADAEGGFVVSWDRTNPGEQQVRRFSADGSPIGATIVVHTSGGLATSDPDVAAGRDGSFVVLWSLGQTADSRDVVAREYARTGSPAGDAFVVSVLVGDEESTQAAEGDGTFAFAWQGPDSSSDGIWGRRYQRRVVFSDGFESDDLAYWSSALP
ncbi:MAG: hypothetical protein L0227_12915 [Chloroflexi bacterium]|nr:hypothetical protein [Chloroflexota bacterium]